jgi:beta-glucosidase
MPFVGAKIVKASKRQVEHTVMDWEIHPPAIYHALRRWNGYHNCPEIIVTENGAAFPDTRIDGAINDEQRTRYLQDHVEQVLRARRSGVQVNGYFVWTLMDNFEWAEGFHPRFGLVYVDFDTQERIVKNSGKWYAGFLKPKEAPAKTK